MVMKHEGCMKENFSNTNFAINNNLDSCNLFHSLNYVTNSGISCIEDNFRSPNRTVEYTSPYLNGTKFQILSQISEKKVLQKKSTDITSSYAQACKIYRANSDEFRCNKKKNKKERIPPLNNFHEPSIPQAASDMNDSEYLKRVDNNRKCRQKKRRVAKDVCRPNETKTYEFYNGDLLRCPGIKADSDNLNKNKMKNGKMLKKKKKKGIESIQSSDVWSMLRDINTFQYISSPPISIGSVETIKKKEKFHKNQREAGFIERCTTEEISYISSYDITSNSQTVLSRQSSFDRVTIIDRTGDFKTKKVFDLNPRTIKKKLCKPKHHIKNRQDERQNFINNPKQISICNIKNGVNDYIKTDCIKTFSKESLNDGLNKYHSQETILNNYDKSLEKIISKDKFIKVTPKKQSTYVQCNDIPEAIKCHQSNNNFIQPSGKNSKVAFTLSNTKVISEYDNKPRKTPRVSIITPKLTKTEIRRRLANLKFPIVVLGKDEISSKFHVVHYDFEQFNGLREQIWLYMTDWLEDLTSRNKYKSYNDRLNDFISTKNKLNVLQPNSKKECSILDRDAELRNNSTGLKNSKLLTETNVEPNNNNNTKTQKTRVLNQFKNKMLGFISNKNQKYSADGNNVIKDNINHVSINQKNLDTNAEGSNKEGNEIIDENKHLTPNKYPWSKVKWASDFIDNILRKMKKGIYYTQVQSEDVKSKLDTDNSIPVEADQHDHAFVDVIEEIPAESTENAMIPGFEETQYIEPIIVEVKMMTRTQISIYHCSTNVVLQFDITIPPRVNTIPSLSLSSFAPVKHEDETTLYKCKTSLANSALPAELCSIIPKLITKINETHEKMLKVPKKESYVPPACCKAMTKLPDVVERMTKGNFSVDSPMKVISQRNSNKKFYLEPYCFSTKLNLLPIIQIKSLCAPLFKRLNSVISSYKSHKTDCTDKLILDKPAPNNCRALVPYVPPCKSNILPISNLDFKLHNHLQKCFTGYLNFVSGLNIWRNLSNCTNYINVKTVDVSIQIPNAVAEFSPNVSFNTLPYKAIHGIKTTNMAETKRLRNERSGYQCLRKNIRKVFKARTKCKSMTNIAKECSTPINKIVNLDDFLQALGCCKLLSAVLQGYPEKKILSSINEMKCWIKEITSAQALLVLLLSNKKETKNLKRFRPVLLQGIAVKRITTATELDMEIEVIEKENICVSQNEGIALLLTSNGYNLLDELYWIAKTTASDYQKPFDDSSKKLLKSLLEKRKKLNPSYLRVMARYVGLGLLKPKKN